MTDPENNCFSQTDGKCLSQMYYRQSGTPEKALQLLGVSETYECYDCGDESELVKQEDKNGKMQCLTCPETMFGANKECVFSCKSHIYSTTKYGTRFCVPSCENGVLTQDKTSRDQYYCGKTCDDDSKNIAGYCVKSWCSND